MAATSRPTPEGDKSIYGQAAQINGKESYDGINTYHMGHQALRVMSSFLSLIGKHKSA